MRILVVGGTLFIGRETVLRLVDRGHEVSVLHRKDHHDLGPGVRNVQADRADLARPRPEIDYTFEDRLPAGAP